VKRASRPTRTGRVPTPAPDPASAYDVAVRYLGSRPRSVAEIKRHLRSKRFDEEAQDQAIDQLRAQRYIDDEAFARYWVEQRERFRPKGDRALVSELLGKGVARETIDVVLGDAAPDAERDDPAEAALEVLRGLLVARVRGEAGVAHPGHAVALLEPLGDRERVLAVALDPERQRLESLEEQERIERAERGADVAETLDAELQDEREVAEGRAVADPVV